MAIPRSKRDRSVLRSSLMLRRGSSLSAEPRKHRANYTAWRGLVHWRHGDRAHRRCRNRTNRVPMWSWSTPEAWQSSWGSRSMERCDWLMRGSARASACGQSAGIHRFAWMRTWYALFTSRRIRVERAHRPRRSPVWTVRAERDPHGEIFTTPLARDDLLGPGETA